MSELIEKVAIAIARVPDGLVAPSWHPEACAAILAVADWLHDQHWHAANDLRRALEREELKEPKP